LQGRAHEWRAACSTDGVRIPSATLTSSATVPPPSQAVSSGGSFQTVLAHASTENRSEPQSTRDAAMSPAHARAEGSSSDGADAKSTSLAGPEGGKVADPGVGNAQTTSDATEAGASAAAGTRSTDALAGTTVSAAGQTSSDANFWHSMVGSFATDAGSESSSVHALDVPATNTATSGLSTKQDRSKAQPEIRKAAAATAVPTVADPGRLPAVNLVSLPGTVHGQENGFSEHSVKNAASENSAGTHARTAAPIDGAGGGEAGAAPLPSSVAGNPQGILVQVSVEPFEAGMDLSMAPGLLADSEPTRIADIGLPACNPMGTGSATTGAASSKVIDGASNTKSVATGTDAAWHAANDGQTAQSLQAEASKTGAGLVISRAVENDGAQTTLQTVLTPGGSHESATAQRATAGAPDSAHPGKTQDLPASAHLLVGEGTPASGINSAKLIQTMGETEMHVGMHSAEFGDISIRTSLSQQQMVTQISLDHNDLSQAISSHLSTVQAKLGEEYGLHASIEINNQGAPLSGGQGNSPHRDQQPPGRSSSGGGMGPAERSESVSSIVGLPSAGSGHGLDIRV
jgi:hypothetical protein